MLRPLALLALPLLLAAAPATAEPGAPRLLEDLLNPQQSARQAEAQVTPLRASALRDAALAVGLRGGVLERARQIHGALQAQSDSLDRTYRFSGLIQPSGILPPVVEEARNALSVSEQTLRSTDLLLRIVRPARFVSVAPSWRDYLLLGLPLQAQVPMPHASLLPRNDEEKALWQQAVRQGWQAGLQQADATFEANLARLSRDYMGMLRYMALRERNLITEDLVAEARSVVAGGGDEMAVGERLYRIAAQPRLNAAPSTWTVRPVQPQEAAR